MKKLVFFFLCFAVVIGLVTQMTPQNTTNNLDTLEFKKEAFGDWILVIDPIHGVSLSKNIELEDGEAILALRFSHKILQKSPAHIDIQTAFSSEVCPPLEACAVITFLPKTSSTNSYTAEFLGGGSFQTVAPYSGDITVISPGGTQEIIPTQRSISFYKDVAEDKGLVFYQSHAINGKGYQSLTNYLKSNQNLELILPVTYEHETHFSDHKNIKVGDRFYRKDNSKPVNVEVPISFDANFKESLAAFEKAGKIYQKQVKTIDLEALNRHISFDGVWLEQRPTDQSLKELVTVVIERSKYNNKYYWSIVYYVDPDADPDQGVTITLPNNKQEHLPITSCSGKSCQALLKKDVRDLLQQLGSLQQQYPDKDLIVTFIHKKTNEKILKVVSLKELLANFKNLDEINDFKEGETVTHQINSIVPTN